MYFVCMYEYVLVHKYQYVLVLMYECISICT